MVSPPAAARGRAATPRPCQTSRLSASTTASRIVADLRYLRALLRQFRITFALVLALLGIVPFLYVWGWRGPSGERIGWGAAAHHVYFLLFGNPSLPCTESAPMEALNMLVPLPGVAVPADGVVVLESRADAPLAALTVADLRDRFGALTLSLDRGGTSRPHPPGETRVSEGDRLLVQALWPDYRRLRDHLGETAAPRGP